MRVWIRKLDGWLSLSNDRFKTELCPIVGPALISVMYARTAPRHGTPTDPNEWRRDYVSTSPVLDPLAEESFRPCGSAK